MTSSSTNQGASRDLQLTDSFCYWLPMTSCFFPLGVIKVVTPTQGWIVLTQKQEETMSEEESFWREMEARLNQDEDEVFHRALEELEPVQRGGAAAAVDDEAGGAGRSRCRFDFRLDPFVDRRSSTFGRPRTRLPGSGAPTGHLRPPRPVGRPLRARVEDLPGPDVTRS